MADKPRFKRVLVKLSGESLSSAGVGIQGPAVEQMLDELVPVTKLGVQVAIVIGGGNLIRGRDLTSVPQINRPTADAMGMLATTINALALQDALESRGVKAAVMGTVTMPAVCEPFSRRKAIEHLDSGRVVILAGGTGSPFFSTDTCSALRACELHVDVIIKATKVDGVFDCDPMKNPAAKKYDTLTYSKALADRLGIMDLTAISMCMENRIPIMVLQLTKPGNLLAAMSGKTVGTLVSE